MENGLRKKFLWIRNQPRRAAIYPDPNLLLLQVYFPLRGLISTRSHPDIKSSICSLIGSQMILPPHFSLWIRVVLKSPAMMLVGISIVSLIFLIVSQHYSFSFILTRIYTFMIDAFMLVLLHLKTYNIEWIVCMLTSSSTSLGSHSVRIPPEAPFEETTMPSPFLRFYFVLELLLLPPTWFLGEKLLRVSLF
jgi:hypothetical protein